MKIIHTVIEGVVTHEIDQSELENFYEEDVKINKVMEGEKIDIKKPYPNEHSARLQSPGRYDDWSRTKDGSLYGEKVKVPASVSVIWGHPKGQKPRIWVAQALRFPKATWTVERAKKWLSDHKISYKTFEPAKKVSKDILIFFIKEDEQIVGGVVYEPMEVDLHDDFASADDIRDACYDFMENVKVFKLSHKGSPLGNKIRILENYLAPADLEINKQKIKKGSWLIVLKIVDKKIWQDIKDGKINAFSMAGRAKRKKKKI